MKKIKLFLVVAVIFAAASAFTTHQHLACSGEKYHYVGTNPDPSQDTDEDNFVEAGIIGVDYICENGEGVCDWYKVSEGHFEPCELDPEGIYTPLLNNTH